MDSFKIDSSSEQMKLMTQTQKNHIGKLRSSFKIALHLIDQHYLLTLSRRMILP